MIPEMSNGEFRYHPPDVDSLVESVEEFRRQFQKFTDTMAPLLTKYTDDLQNLRVNLPMLFRIEERVDQRRDYYRYFHSTKGHAMIMAETKEIALYCYWIVRLKPISFEQAQSEQEFYLNNNFTLNELFAAYLLISVILGMDEENEGYFRKREDIYTLIYSLANREISKEALILYVESFRKS